MRYFDFKRLHRLSQLIFSSDIALYLSNNRKEPITLLDSDPDKITVKDIMTKSVVSVDAGLNVNEAAKMMEDAKVGAIIVMEDNTPIGIITDRDFATKIVAHAYPITTPVKQIMSSPLITIGPDESVWSISGLMNSRNIRKIPVVDDDKVVGIVTATDLVKQFATCTEDDMRKMYYHSISEVFRQYSPYN